MKKRFFLFLMLALLLTGCSQRTSKKYTVIATVFPAYDWAREILGDNPDVELRLLSDKGIDLHSYQATAQDMVRISGCNLFLYVGGESDEWVEKVLDSVPNPARREVSMMEAIESRLVEEEEVEGMQIRNFEEDEAFDEHIWLSVRNAEALCVSITEALCDMAPEYARDFQANCSAYLEKLSALDWDFSESTEQGGTLLFCDRFPFRYLAEDYGLNYYAPFSGCSGDSQASFATVLFLAEKAEEQQAVFILEDSDGQLARTVIGCTAAKNQKILTLNSMQAISLEDAQHGITYLSLMEQNLNAIKEALCRK